MDKVLCQIEPVAVFHSPLTEKFGLPRQAGLAESLEGWIELEPEFRREEALRGLEDFDYLWLIWGFHLNRAAGQGGKSQDAAGQACAVAGQVTGPGDKAQGSAEAEYSAGGGQSGHCQLTVRPPRLGGNTRVGVFASRSPFRPNGMGLSSVRISRIEGCRIYVLGADLADGTPIFDIKPYVEYADSHPGVRSGFVDARVWETLEVAFPSEYQGILATEELRALREILAQDPRPQYHNDPRKVYGLSFGSHNVRFRVEGMQLVVLSID